MSVFSSSYLHFTASMPMTSESDIPIHTFSNFTKVSRFVSSLDLPVPTIFEILQQLMERHIHLYMFIFFTLYWTLYCTLYLVFYFIVRLSHSSLKVTWFDLTAEKVCPTYPPIYRYGDTPSNLQWTQIYVTSRPEPETRVWPFPNPKTRLYRMNPVWKL